MASWSPPADVVLDGYTFSCNFDSGNFQRVEKTPTGYGIWVRPDCSGTEFETGNRTWFYFSVAGGRLGYTINLEIMNLNKQNLLFSSDMRPVVKAVPSSPDWQRCQSTASTSMVDDEFHVRFRHRFEADGDVVFFAFSYPKSYAEMQADLERFDERYGVIEGEVDTESDSKRDAIRLPVSDIYYHRDLLTTSLDGRRLDLVTITSADGRSPEREPTLPGLYPDASRNRCHVFPSKRVAVISSRVHPGETPASHVFDGIVQFLLSETDPRAILLRKMFVFKLVPVLNPDGVARGHYRADNRGVNLNRCYTSPDPATEPAIFAVKSLCASIHERGKFYFYLDLHAHATKRGCFVYGNHIPDLDEQVRNVLYARMVEVNSMHFDFAGCNFTEKNMTLKDRRDSSVSKEGAGRVAFFHSFGLVHSYTLECNYNMGRICNHVGRAQGAGGRGSPAPETPTTMPKYTPEIWQGVGKACMAPELLWRDNYLVNLHLLKKHDKRKLPSRP